MFSPTLKHTLLALCISLPVANASLVVTYAESANEVNSTLSGTTVFTFNDLSTGTHEDVEWSGVGTLDKVHILDADSYGGAVDPGFSTGSPYIVQADFAGVTSTTLTLDAPHAYFGLWWSAGDSQNILEFYNGINLVGRFTTATLLDRLATDDSYLGNPRDRNLNSGENYAFINFFGQAGTTWDRIVLSNGPGSGFESDNYTDRAAPWSLEIDGPMPGKPLAIVDGVNVVPIPEPASLAMVALGSLALVARRRRA